MKKEYKSNAIYAMHLTMSPAQWAEIAKGKSQKLKLSLEARPTRYFLASCEIFWTAGFHPCFAYISKFAPRPETSIDWPGVALCSKLATLAT